jgi:sigma-B regulation protein RsbU (phosphoserine phosphatase)
MFCTEQFRSQKVRLGEGDTMLLYTDGYLDAQNGQDEEYGMPRVLAMAASGGALKPRALVDACVKELARFRGARPFADDVTIMSVRRSD